MNGSPAALLRGRAILALQTHLPTDLPPLIVASMGRSGSTLVFESIAEAFSLARFGRSARVFPRLSRRTVRESAFDHLDGPFHPGVVYKTHALAEELPKGTGASVVFLYGRASDAAQSVFSCRTRYGPEWVDLHLSHLRARGSFQEILERDVLRFAEQIDGWTGHTDRPVLALRYETLWDNKSKLDEFIGVPVRLPVRHARTGPSSLTPEIRRQLEETYHELDQKIDALPDAMRIG